MGRKIVLWAVGVAVVIGGAYLLDAVYQSRVAREMHVGSTSTLTRDDGWYTPRGTAQKKTLEGEPMSECVPSEFLPAEAMKHAADRGWTSQVVDHKKNEPPMFLNLIMYEANGTEHNILYFRGVNSS